MKFEDVVGHYRNRDQAFSNPSTWPQIDIRIEKCEKCDHMITTKSWYKYKGEENPYNYIQYDYEQMDENIIYAKTTNLLTNTPSCPFIWNWDGVWWNGNPDGECIQSNTRMVSKIRFNGKEYRAIDTGYDLETGKFRWGKEESEGEFLFKRLDK